MSTPSSFNSMARYGDDCDARERLCKSLARRKRTTCPSVEVDSWFALGEPGRMRVSDPANGLYIVVDLPRATCGQRDEQAGWRLWTSIEVVLRAADEDETRAEALHTTMATALLAEGFRSAGEVFGLDMPRGWVSLCSDWVAHVRDADALAGMIGRLRRTSFDGWPDGDERGLAEP